MTNKSNVIPTYSEKREIECQTELEDDFFVEDEELCDEEVQDGLHDLLQLTHGEPEIGLQCAVLEPPLQQTFGSVLKPTSTKDFTIASKKLLRSTKVITPSKFASEPVDESKWEVLSKDYSKKAVNSTEKQRKQVTKKHKPIIYEILSSSPINATGNQFITVQTGTSGITNYGEVAVIPAQFLNNTQSQNITIRSSNQLDEHLINYPTLQNDNSQKTINSQKIVSTVGNSRSLLKIPPIHNAVNPMQNILPAGLVCVQNIESHSIPVKDRNESSVLKHSELSNVKKDDFQIKSVVLEDKTKEPINTGQSQTSQPINTDQSQTNYLINTGQSQHKPISNLNAQITHIHQQQLSPLNVKKLVETIQNQGKDIQHLTNIISNENGEIQIGGTPVKFIVLKPGIDLNSGDIHIDKPKAPDVININHSKDKQLDMSRPEKDSLKEIETTIERYDNSTQTGVASVTDILEENLQNRNVSAEELKPNEYHEMLKEAKRSFRLLKSEDLNRNDVKKKYKCDICAASFTKSCNLSAHKRIHTNDRRFMCSVCDQKFYTGTKLRAHMRIHTDSRPFECEICHKSFREKSILKNHQLTHEGNKEFKCDLCDKNFFRKSKLDIHLKTHTGEKPYKCEHCGRTFAVIYYYRRHVKRHAEKKEFKCEICMKGFHLKESYKFHLLTHDDSKKKKCDVCLKSFIRDSQLKRHDCQGPPIATAKSDFHCMDCDSKFLSLSQLVIHRKEHKGETTYKCTVCGKVFLHDYLLKRHMVVHTDKKPYKCKICKMEFGWASSVRTHILKMHKDCIDDGILDQHERRTSEDFDRQCEVCSEVFLTDFELQQHDCVMKETAQSQFYCSECNLNFADSLKLEVHCNQHKRDTTYKCKMCDKSFMHDHLLQHHILNVHKDEVSGEDKKVSKNNITGKNGDSSIKTRDLCKKETPKSEYIQHMSLHKRFPFICCICGMMIKDIQSFQNHVFTHQQEIPQEENKTVCKVCQTELQDTEYFSHALLHVDYSTTCHVCHQSFQKERLLKIHLKSHNENKPEVQSFTCDRCKNSFPESDRESHELVHLKYPFTCHFCFMNFELEIFLQNHFEIHKGDKPHRCNICGEKFATFEQLTTHKESHKEEEDRPQQCNVCGKRFRYTTDLKVHRRKHTGEKPFSCDLCTESFARNDYLKKHKVRCHNIGEKLKCFCSQEFHTKSELTRHVRTYHDKIKSCVCHICDKKFSFQYELIKHMCKTHQVNQPFKCSDCPDAFLRRKQLNRHIKRKHPLREKQNRIVKQFIKFEGNYNQSSYDEMHVDSRQSEAKSNAQLVVDNLNDQFLPEIHNTDTGNIVYSPLHVHAQGMYDIRSSGIVMVNESDSLAPAKTVSGVHKSRDITKGTCGDKIENTCCLGLGIKEVKSMKDMTEQDCQKLHVDNEVDPSMIQVIEEPKKAIIIDTGPVLQNSKYIPIEIHIETRRNGPSNENCQNGGHEIVHKIFSFQVDPSIPAQYVDKESGSVIEIKKSDTEQNMIDINITDEEGIHNVSVSTVNTEGSNQELSHVERGHDQELQF